MKPQTKHVVHLLTLDNYGSHATNQFDAGAESVLSRQSPTAIEILEYACEAANNTQLKAVCTLEQYQSIYPDNTPEQNKHEYDLFSEFTIAVNLSGCEHSLQVYLEQNHPQWKLVSEFLMAVFDA